MTFGEAVRRQLFWTKDWVKGGHKRKHLAELQYLLDEPHDGAWKIAQRKQLEKLLCHAVETTGFYRFAFDRSPNQGHSIESFPTINKETIRSDISAFVSNKFDRSSLSTHRTSGSTGLPLEMLQDPNKRQRHFADVNYFGNRAGFKMGRRLFYLRLWSSEYGISRLKRFQTNIEPISVEKLSHSDIEQMISAICKCRTKVGLLGYPSALEQVCRFLDRNHSEMRLPRNVGSIITMAESLHQNTRDRLTEYFGVRPVARYSNTENGIVGQQCNHKSNEFHLNVASFYVEILDETDRPVSEGEIGRIVITDLFNFGLPLIRYDTGDIGAFSSDSQCEWKTPVLTRIEGRKSDMICDASGQSISSHYLRYLLYCYPELNQYQLIQKARTEYLVKISIDDTFERETELISHLKEYLGAEANIAIAYVDDIPLLRSGKRRLVANEYLPPPC